MAARSGVLALSGYGLSIKVERGHLVVEDGLGSARRRGRFSRVTPGLKRIVVFGRSGAVSLDALGWLHDLGIGFAQIDHEGELIVVGGSKSQERCEGAPWTSTCRGEWRGCAGRAFTADSKA